MHTLAPPTRRQFKPSDGLSALLPIRTPNDRACRLRRYRLLHPDGTWTVRYIVDRWVFWLPSSVQRLTPTVHG